MLKTTEQTVSIHGFSGDDPIVFVGGKDKKMSKSRAKSLRHKGFTVKESPNEIDAKSSKNLSMKMKMTLEYICLSHTEGQLSFVL